jgi:hypothetical protein
MPTIQAMSSYLLIVLLLFTSGCATDSSIGQQKISKTEALEIAKREFKMVYPDRVHQHGVNIVESSDLNAWNVWFTGKGIYAVPGGYTKIRVDKITGKAVLLPSN